MNKEQEKILARMLDDAQCGFHNEISTDENKDYRRGYYAGRLYAALEIQNILKRTEDGERRMSEV